MTTSERMRTCERMRKAAMRIVRDNPPLSVTQWQLRGRGGELWNEPVVVDQEDWATLRTCWRSFPENFYDMMPMPSPLQIIAICERMEREHEEDKQFSESLK